MLKVRYVHVREELLTATKDSNDNDIKAWSTKWQKLRKGVTKIRDGRGIKKTATFG